MKGMILLASLLFTVSAYSASEISRVDDISHHEVKCGVISVSRIDATSDELMKLLSKKSDALGCRYFAITSFESEGNSRATAVVYH